MFSRVFLAIALIAMPSAYGYSAGAPDAACVDMKPQHGVDPQPSQAPYKLLLSTNSIRSSSGGDNVVHLELKGNGAGDTIKGFMVQARIGSKPVGQFRVESTKYAQLLNCAGDGNAVTHKKIFGNGPKSIKFSWTPPAGLKGDVKFYATVAFNGGIFWVNQIIEPVSIV